MTIVQESFGTYFALHLLHFLHNTNLKLVINWCLVSVFVACHTVEELPAVLVDDVGHGQADRHPAQQDHGEAEPVQIKVACLKVFRLNPDKLRVGVFHKMIPKFYELKNVNAIKL